MKAHQLLVTLVCLALGLGTAIAYVKRPTQTLGSAPELGLAVQRSAPEPEPAAQTNPPSAAAPSMPFSWRQLESEDYHKYIDNLRSIGCPEQTIRDIVLADVNKLYAARENPLKSKPPSMPGGAAAETEEQKLERLRQLRVVQQEKRWVVKELLGIDIPLDLLPSSGSRDYHAFEIALRALPVEKRDAVQMLQENYWLQSDALKARYDKKRTPEFVVESRQLTESLRQELTKILSPTEMDDYDMRTSSTAKQLSSTLATYFRPTETEFRQIFRAKRDYEETVQRLSIPTAPATPPSEGGAPKPNARQLAADRQAVEQARTAALNQMNEQLKSTLGEDRYTEYERSQDRTYDLLARLGFRYGLPQEKVLEAYELQKSVGPKPGPVGAGSAQDRQVDRAALQRQVTDQLTAILGEQAARGYLRVNGGRVPIQ